MADVKLKAFKFPGLNDNYTIPWDEADGLKSIQDSLEFSEHDGYFSDAGVIISPTAYAEKYTDLIRVNGKAKLLWEYSLTNSNYMWAACLPYNAQGVRIGSRQTLVVNETKKYKSGAITLPENADSIKFCYRSFGDTEVFKVYASNNNALLKLKNDVLGKNDTVIADYDVTSVSYTISDLGAGLYKIDATQLTSGDYIRCEFKAQDGTGRTIQTTKAYKGKSAYAYFDPGTYLLTLYIRVVPNQDSYSGHVTVTKVNNNNETAKEMLTGITKMPTVNSLGITSDLINVGKWWTAGGLGVNQTRTAIGLIHYTGLFTVKLTDYTNYKFAIIQYEVDDMSTVNSDTGWITSGERKVSNDFGRVFGVTLSRVDGATMTLADVASSGLTIIPDGDYYDKIVTLDDLKPFDEARHQYDSFAQELSADSIKANLSVFAGRFKPCYDHLFVNQSGASVIVPHESLFHIRLSKKLGYNTIEANVAATATDGVFIVNHLTSGKFGQYFNHVDGTTDISDISVNSKTWDWITENVRYVSQIPKYRVRPVRLEEFLGECKQQNIIPFITATNTTVIDIANKILGKGNYVAYGATRANCPDAIIYHWVTRTTEADILAYCESVGKPFIYGMANPTAFTDEQLKSIVGTLHKNGYMIGTSYADANWSKYSYLGFDFNGTQYLVNRIESGNLHNLDTLFGFDDFTFTNATETNGVLTYSAQGTLIPDIENTTYQVCMIDVELWFSGTVSISGLGLLGTQSYTSDGTYPVFVAVPIFNGSPKITITANSGTVIYDAKYKVSVV